jgi:Flp pilus assembly protein TadB
LVTFITTAALTGAPPIAACFEVIAAGAPTVVVHSRARRRRTELRSVWPEVLDDLASAIRAGLSLPEALIALGERGPEEVRTEFRQFAEDYRATASLRRAGERHSRLSLTNLSRAAGTRLRSVVSAPPSPMPISFSHHGRDQREFVTNGIHPIRALGDHLRR